MAQTSGELRWSLEPDSLRFPDAPVHGRLPTNSNFQPQTITANFQGLSFVQSSKGRDSWQLTVSVPGFILSEAVENKKFKHAPIKGPPDFKAPRTTLSWSSNNGARSGNDAFQGNFAMTLETGTLTAGAIPAKIYLCVPDEGKTVLAGSFKITGYNGTPLVFTKIYGQIDTPPAINEKALYVGSVGITASKKAEAEGSHLRLNEHGELPAGMNFFSSGIQGSDVRASGAEGASYTLKGRLPGWHLIMLAAAGVRTEPEIKRPEGFASFGPTERFEPLPRIYDMRWIEIKDPRAKIECNLHADPDQLGTAKIEVPGVRDGALVTFLPVAPDDLKQMPDIDGASSSLRVRVKEGKTDEVTLPEGSYDFRCEGRKQRVIIERQRTITVKLHQEV